MIKIFGIDTHKLHNAEHFEFINVVIRVITMFIEGNPLGQVARDITMLFNILKASFVIEDDAFKLIMKSSLTRLIGELDIVRDNDITNFTVNVRALQSHFQQAVRDAAYRVMVELKGFGEINRKGYDAETAYITNLVQSLRGKLADDVATLGLTEWVEQIDRSNIAFAEAAFDRSKEQTEKNSLARMRDARLTTDSNYRPIVNRINAAIEYNGPQEYEAFVAEINTQIKHYNDIIARRKGVNAAKKKDKDEEGEESITN